MDSTPIPMCDTCAEEYPYMDSTSHPTCEACLYDDAIKSTNDPSAVPPLKYCKDGCGIKLGRKAGTMCGGCKRKTEGHHQITQSNSQHRTQSTGSSISVPFLVDDVDPARISSIRSTFQIPQLSLSRPDSMSTSTPGSSSQSLFSRPIAPIPPVRQKKRPAEHPLQSQPMLLGYAQDRAYQHGEEASKRIRMERIGENKLHHRDFSCTCFETDVVKLKYNAHHGPKSHGIPDHTHDVDFSDQDWEIKIMRTATEHFRQNSVGIFPPGNQNIDLNTYPALPSFDSAYYSLGIGTGILSGDRLKQKIIAPIQPGKRAPRGPLALSLFFAAATYLAAVNLPSPPSSDVNTDSEGEDDPSEAAHISPIQLPTTSSSVVTVIDRPTNGFVNSPIINTQNWTSSISRSVSLAIKRIHQLADQGIDPLKVPNSSVVAAQDPYDIASTPFPQEIGTPLPDGHPARNGQIITTISWSDALQLRLGIGLQIALYGCSLIRTFGCILPSVDSLARPMKSDIPWTNVILMALARPNIQSTPEAISQPLVFGQWEALAEVKRMSSWQKVEKDGSSLAKGKGTALLGHRQLQIITEESGDQATYLQDSIAYHQASCLLEEFKLAVFVKYGVTIAQKKILNSLQVVFNMVMIQNCDPYKIEELLEHSPEAMSTTIDKALNAPTSLLLDALNAFVHYTYDYFKGQALLCDIKTVNGRLTGMRMFDRRFQWSPSDESPDEIDTFKLGHQCGEFCNVLKLPSPDFKYPTSDDRAEGGEEVAIDPVLESLEHIHPKQSEAEHDTLPSDDLGIDTHS
ncbi:uncharacterized protein MELLADRAFT_91580 [Melampsora larici-populina 98AG31]|uniref:Alpha-type protein kinase domain-containing protein n=1 Tax=Melampsora larici-populina (strain 98AG31 / pathotype 3-4-7) TaxID=747676 RepID=F4SEJ8_MELLP|nr:uncharacterized protein MELLADRAFT_91580 [Melampsora larici-populina 98AG31]EGF96928.1 hypothetical protein MELLADRAFT_91580 [Melampsora larici-populina 98AG31]